MRKIVYFNKENSKLLDELTKDKLDDFSNYVCKLIRKDLEREGLDAVSTDLEEIKQKLDMIQEAIKGGITTSISPVTDHEEKPEVESEDLSMTLEFL